MSQKITLLYTKDKIHPNNIPQDQIYFEEKGYSIFPLNIDEIDMEAITNTFKKFETMAELNDNVYAFSPNAQLIINLVRRLKVKTFLLDHYSDWADIPVDFFILIVKDNKIYTESDHDSIEDILGYFQWSDDRKDIVDIGKYKSYDICEYLFHNKKE